MILFSGCEEVQPKNYVNSPNVESLVDQPVTIEINGDKNLISDFSAQINVFEKNSRRDLERRLIQDYRLSLKVIDGYIYSRMDYAEEKGSFRSVLRTPQEITIFDRKTNEVFQRYPLTEEERLLSRIGEGSLLGKGDLEMLRITLGDLSYRISEDGSGHYLKVERPSQLLQNIAIDGTTVLGHTIYFDIESALPVEDILRSQTSDGTLRTISTKTEYQDIDGLPVKVAMKRVDSYDFNYTINIDDRVLPVIEEGADLPYITEQEMKRMEEQGDAFYFYRPIIGDPSNPDYSITTDTFYQDIELNSLSESLFRVNL